MKTASVKWAAEMENSLKGVQSVSLNDGCDGDDYNHRYDDDDDHYDDDSDDNCDDDDEEGEREVDKRAWWW